MPQERRTIQVQLPDGKMSRPFPADMPPAQILAMIEQEAANRETGDPNMDRVNRSMPRSPMSQLQEEQYGQDQPDVIPNALKMLGVAAPFAVPGVGPGATALRLLAGAAPMVAARAVEGGNPEELLRTAGAELALGGIGEGAGALLRIPAVQKAAIKTSGFFTGPFSYARNKGQYDRWAESLSRLDNNHGVMPAGRASTIQRLTDDTQSELERVLSEMDMRFAPAHTPAQAPPGVAPRPAQAGPRAAQPSSRGAEPRLSAGAAPEVLERSPGLGMSQAEFDERLANLHTSENPLDDIQSAMKTDALARPTLPQRFGAIEPQPSIRVDIPEPDILMPERGPAPPQLTGNVMPAPPGVAPRPRLNVAQTALDAATKYVKKVPKGSLEGATSEASAAKQGAEIVSDLLTRGQHAPASAKLQMKGNLAPMIQQAIENQVAYGGKLNMDPAVFKQVHGYDPFNIKPSELHELNKGLRQQINDILSTASEHKQMPREGKEVLMNDIHRAFRDLLNDAGKVNPADKTSDYERLQTQAHDLINANKFRGAVRRDPAMFPMRAGFGGAVTGGTSRLAGGLGAGAMLGGPQGAALGGLAAVLGLEPSVLYSLLYKLPKGAAKAGPSLIRATKLGQKPDSDDE